MNHALSQRSMQASKTPVVRATGAIGSSCLSVQPNLLVDDQRVLEIPGFDLLVQGITGQIATWHTRLRGLFTTIVVAISSLAIHPVAHADNFKIYHADTELVDKVYRLNANLDYNFSEEALKAIDSGVPLVLVLEIELYKPRKYIWDKSVAELEQRYKLQYHAVAEQYIVTNLNSGSQQTYGSFHSAIASIRNINGLPVIDENLLEKGITYSARMRASVELSALPGPLRLNAIFSRKWRMDSDWYEWALLKN